MSEYTFQCWNSSCGDMVDRDWDEVEEDISGSMAYCSEDCFQEHCKSVGDGFNSRCRMKPHYKVGDDASELQISTALKQPLYRSLH